MLVGMREKKRKIQYNFNPQEQQDEDEGYSSTSSSEPDEAEVEEIKGKIIRGEIIPLIDLQYYNYPLKDEPVKTEIAVLPGVTTEPMDIEGSVLNIMKFLNEDTENAKKRAEYEKRTNQIDWDNLEYQHSQTDYAADLPNSDKSA